MKIKRDNPPAQDTSVRATFLAGNGSPFVRFADIPPTGAP